MKTVTVAVVACLLATAGSAIAITQRVESNKDLRDGLQQVVRIGCERDREFASQLRTIVQRGRDNARRYRDEGVLTQEQYERAVRENQRALELLSLPDCKAYVLLVTG